MAGLTEAAKGVYVIAVTPFADDGALDLASVDRMVDFYEEAGATGITILGQLGEAAKLTAEESRSVAERVLRRLDGRLPVVVGVTAPGLAPMRELAESVMDMGAAGVMVAPPWTLRTDDQVFGFYAVGGRGARGDALRAAGLSADHQRHDRAQGDRADRPRGADLRDAQA